jgi:hypothetical protein
MNLSTIEMSRDEAIEALKEWSAVVKAKHSDEDAAIAEGYARLADGKALLSLTETIRAGGEDDMHRPRLAVAPVKADTIYLDRHRNGDVRFCVNQKPGAWKLSVSSVGVCVDDALAEIDYNARQKLSRWDAVCLYRAMVPVVPPRFRQRGWKGAHVLFEAEWAEHAPPAPVDPALIRHLRGDLWVVAGVWDLTPLERAVLTERNRA